MRQPGRRPWVRLDVTYCNDAAVRLARCGAVFPWLVCQLKLNGGACSDTDLHPSLAAQDLNIPDELAAAQIEGAKRFGLLTKGADDRWRTPNWDKYQIDPRPNHRERDAAPPVSTDRTGAGRPTDPPGRPGENTGHGGGVPFSPRGVPGTDRADGTGRDVTNDGTLTPQTPLSGGWVSASGTQNQDDAGGTIKADHDADRDITATEEERDGVRWYTPHGAALAMMGRWRDEHWHMPALSRLSRDVANAAPAEVIDLALTDQHTGTMFRPHGMLGVLKRLQAPAKKGRLTDSASAAVRDEGVAAMVAKYTRDPAEVASLVDELLVAGERPPPALLPVIHDHYKRARRAVPELFQ